MSSSRQSRKTLTENDEAEIEAYISQQHQEQDLIDNEYENFIQSFEDPNSVPTLNASLLASQSPMQSPDEYRFDINGNLIYAPSNELFSNWNMFYPQMSSSGYQTNLPQQCYSQPVQPSVEHLDSLMQKTSLSNATAPNPMFYSAAFPIPTHPAMYSYPSNPLPQTSYPSRGLVSCKYFPNCKFGNTCKFYHPPLEATTVSNQMQFPVNDSCKVNNHFTEQNIQLPSSQSSSRRPHVPLHKQLCKYFPHCTLGKSCTYYHPVIENE